MRIRQRLILKRIFDIQRLIILGIDALLLALIGYYAMHIAHDYRQPVPHIETADTAPLQSVAYNEPKDNPLPPFEHYKHIWERNLFNPIRERKQPAEKIAGPSSKPKALEKQKPGLELKGIALNEDAAKSVAVIHLRRENYQDIFKQGDRVENAVIKSILGDKIIINAGKGDEVLTLNYNQSSAGAAIHKINKSSPGMQRIHNRKVSINRDQLEDALAKLDQHWNQMQITPHLIDGRTTGMKIKGMNVRNVLFRMGVRNGDVIEKINEQEYQSPEQLGNIFYDIESNEEYKIKLLRGGKFPVLLNVTIQ